MTLFPQAFRYGFSRIHQTLVKLQIAVLELLEIQKLVRKQ